MQEQELSSVADAVAGVQEDMIADEMEGIDEDPRREEVIAANDDIIVDDKDSTESIIGQAPSPPSSTNYVYLYYRWSFFVKVLFLGVFCFLSLQCHLVWKDGVEREILEKNYSPERAEKLRKIQPGTLFEWCGTVLQEWSLFTSFSCVWVNYYAGMRLGY